MILFKDVFTGKEMFTDAFKYKTIGEHGLIYEVQGKMTTDTSSIDDSMIGGNKSAKEPDDTATSTVHTGCNIVSSCNLREALSFTIEDYKEQLKIYVKKIVNRVKEEEGTEAYEVFRDQLNTDVISVIMRDMREKNYRYFVGEDDEYGSPKGMIAVMYFLPEDTAKMNPVMYFIKPGLEEELC